VERRVVLEYVAAAIEGLPSAGVRRVGIDGVDGAGKTMFADELGSVLTQRGTPVVRASIDGFHRPQAERWVRGRESPEGFYLDSYDYPRVRSELLDPLAPGGNRRIRRAIHDHRTDQLVDSPVEVIGDGSVLILDGIFLHRPELIDVWDLSVFLHVPTAVSVARCAERDGPAPEATRRYVDGQRLYLDACRPAERATIVIDNTDLGAPVILRATPGG
jgi:uridine kinase